MCIWVLTNLSYVLKGVEVFRICIGHFLETSTTPSSVLVNYDVLTIQFFKFQQYFVGWQNRQKYEPVDEMV